MKMRMTIEAHLFFLDPISDDGSMRQAKALGSRNIREHYYMKHFFYRPTTWELSIDRCKRLWFERDLNDINDST